jgi:hypothetical protein
MSVKKEGRQNKDRSQEIVMWMGLKEGKSQGVDP